MNPIELGIVCALGLMYLACVWLDRVVKHLTQGLKDVQDVRYKLNRHYQKSGLDASKWVAR